MRSRRPNYTAVHLRRCYREHIPSKHNSKKTFKTVTLLVDRTQNTIGAQQTRNQQQHRQPLARFQAPSFEACRASRLALFVRHRWHIQIVLRSHTRSGFFSACCLDGRMALFIRHFWHIQIESRSQTLAGSFFACRLQEKPIPVMKNNSPLMLAGAFGS